MDRRCALLSPSQSLTPNLQPPAAYTPPHLAERIRAEQAALEARGATDGERKTITALFADLKGSTALIERLDPEEARAVIDPALQLMMDAVHQYDGYVAQALGDGIFALFGAPLQDLKRLILEKTQGTPFFMEEIMQELFEQGILVRSTVGVARRDRPSEGAQSGAPLQIPPTVQGVLSARIDRLMPDEKALLQQLSVIGREFPLSLVRQVLTQSEADLYRLLASLQRKEFLYEQSAFPEVEYIFKHALTQEVAYGTVLQEQRKLLHERTGHAVEALYSATLHEHYSDLAHHYRRSPNTEKAIEYLHLAGQQAVQRSANGEAVTHFTATLDILKTLPDTSERAEQELTLQLALAPPLMFTKGLAAPEGGAAYTRALELCRQVGETPQLFQALWGALVFSLLRAEVQTARELAEQLLSLAQETQDSTLLLIAHYWSGAVLFSLGEMVAARAHCEQAVALYDPQQWRSSIALYGTDIGVACVSFLARVLWFPGYPDQALTRSREALTLAQEIAHPVTMTVVWMNNTLLHQSLHEGRPVQQQAEALLTLSHEQGVSTPSLWAIIWRGWALAVQGQAEDGIKQIHQGLVAAQDTRVELLRPYHLALLAEVYGKIGQIEEGLTALTEGLETIEKTGERQYEAELYRLKGELLLVQARQQATGDGQQSENSSQ